jgi:hypothetical protein
MARMQTSKHFQSTIPAFSWRKWEKHWQMSVRMGDADQDPEAMWKKDQPDFSDSNLLSHTYTSNTE